MTIKNTTFDDNDVLGFSYDKERGRAVIETMEGRIRYKKCSYEEFQKAHQEHNNSLYNKVLFKLNPYIGKKLMHLWGVEYGEDNVQKKR
jgi:hypothetical protein